MPTPKNTAPRLPEIWMRLHNRKLLLKLMAIKGVSNRGLAKAAGYKSHSYMNRLASGDAVTLDVEPAVRIAEFLEIPVDELFTPRTSSVSGDSPKRNKTAA